MQAVLFDPYVDHSFPSYKRKSLFNSMSMKDVERREARKQKPLSHVAEELGDNCPLFSTPSLPPPPKGNRQRTCHDLLLEKGGLDVAVSTVVVESRALRVLLDARLILAVRNGGAERSAVVGACQVAPSPRRSQGLYDSTFKSYACINLM